MENTAIVRGTRKKFRPITRCQRSKAQPAQKRTDGFNGNGFLNHSFPPVWGLEGNRERLAGEFDNSLANLCQYYNLAIPHTALPFPQNIYHLWKEVSKAISEIDKNYHCMIIADKGKRAVLSVLKTFSLNGLYYLPVRSYWRWAQCAQQQRVAELLTVIFAYLHQVVEIPFYAENGSFMDSQYEALEQWIREAEDEGQDDAEEKEWREHQENTIYELRQAGCHILRMIQDVENLKKMERVITDYHHANKWELEWELLGIEFLQLYRQYPKRSLPSSINADLVYPYEDERINCFQYTGFHWSNKDCFADELDDMINCSFQEISVMDEPTAVQLFDQMPIREEPDFDFEKRLFGLIERLRDLLDDYDHEEYNGAI
jgi:hypothetical protein